VGKLGDKTATGAIEIQSVGNMMGRVLVGMLLLLCLVEMGEADGTYWWMGTGAFRRGDRSIPASVRRGKNGRKVDGDQREGNIEQGGEIIWPSDDDVYVLQSNAKTLPLQSNDNTYTEQSDGSAWTSSDNAWSQSSNDNEYTQQSNDDSWTSNSNDQSSNDKVWTSNDNSYAQQSNDNAWTQQINGDGYTEQSPGNKQYIQVGQAKPFHF
jgi:hypothetical protein